MMPSPAPSAFLVVALLVSGVAGAGAGEEKKMSDIELVESFIDAFNAKDVDKVMGFFTEDAVYHNMPMEPAEGTEAIRRLIESFVAPAESIDWEILHISRQGSTVLTERIDRFVLGGKTVTLPVMGAFELRDGKIAAWRDYFDLATWQRQTQP